MSSLRYRVMVAPTQSQPLLLHKVSGDAGINAAAHCNQYLSHQTMGQPPSQCSQSGNLLWS